MKACPNCKSRATKLLSLNTGLYTCQICETSYPPNPPPHEWTDKHGMQCCANCGVVRKADDQNKPCPGVVRVSLREDLAALSHSQEGGGE